MGVVYHAHYLVWCEIGRTELIRSLGTSYARLEADGVRLAVAEADIRYLSPARYDDLVRVETRVEHVRSRTLSFGYELSRVEPGPVQRLATASTTLVALDARGEARRLPEGLVRRLRDRAASEGAPA